MIAAANPIDQSGGHDCLELSFSSAESTALFMNVEEDEFKRDRDVITGVLVQDS
jgi:hypothetical protein